MSDADDTGIRDGHDLRVMWRTVTTVAVIVAAFISGLVYAVSEWTVLKTRVSAVEKWQENKEKEAARELWRRERERNAQPIQPKGGM